MYIVWHSFVYDMYFFFLKYIDLGLNSNFPLKKNLFDVKKCIFFFFLMKNTESLKLIKHYVLEKVANYLPYPM